MRIRWPWRKAHNLTSISNPILIDLFNAGARNYSGVPVSEATALSLSALYRALAVISGTIAGLPLRTQRDVDGVRTRVNSFLDTPGGKDGPTSFEWKETLLLHLLLHGNAYGAHVYNQAGAIVSLELIHPLAVTPEWDPTVPGGKRFVVQVPLPNGRSEPRIFDSTTMTHVPGPSVDGLKGMGIVEQARNSLGTAIAGDRAAAKMFSTGALYAGMVTPEEDVTEAEAKAIKESLDAKLTGWENSGEIAVINRKLKFTPWTMSLEDAQFLQSRQFQIEEISRWTGVPPHLLMQTEKQTSWGTGVAEQNRGLARFTLAPWTSRIEERLSRLLPQPRFVEFDYAGLLQPSPETEIPLLIAQVQAGLMTANEARRIRGMDPVPGGDSLPTSSGTAAPAPATPAPQLEAVAA